MSVHFQWVNFSFSDTELFEHWKHVFFIWCSHPHGRQRICSGLSSLRSSSNHLQLDWLQSSIHKFNWKRWLGFEVGKKQTDFPKQESTIFEPSREQFWNMHTLNLHEPGSSLCKLTTCRLNLSWLIENFQEIHWLGLLSPTEISTVYHQPFV